MPTNEVFEYADRLSVVVTNPVAPAAGGPCRYGVATGVALTVAGGGGNTALEATVDFGHRVWTLTVTDTVGGSIALGDALFYVDGAPGTISNNPAGRFFGFACATVGVGATASIRVLHVPSPGSGTIGAGTINSANIAAGAISADATGRALFAANFFNVATVLAKFATDSIANAALLQLIADGAFAADAPTRALFADAIWTQAKLAPASLDGTVVKTVADANTIGGIPIMFQIASADAASGDQDVVVSALHKVRVVNVWLVKTANQASAEANSITIKNAASAITDVMAMNNTPDKTIIRASTIDDANWEIAAGGTLRITRVRASGAGQIGCTVFVQALVVA
jgi:hypothetical protein